MLEGWEEEEGGGRLFSLLQRYGGPPSGIPAVERLETAANLAVLQIGSKLLYGEQPRVRLLPRKTGRGNLPRPSPCQDCNSRGVGRGKNKEKSC